MIENRKISAPFILVGNGDKLESKVLVIDESGLIVSLDNLKDHDHASVQMLDGFIIPGLINTHCHLELSHMKSKIPSGTGLINFISHVVKFRDIEQQIIDEAIVAADREMFDNGIQAVGDICNKIDTAAQKEISPIAYYSFVEMFDFLNPAMTQQFVNQYQEVYDKQASSGNNKKTMVPHAPYSVSQELFDYLSENTKANETVSIHNQETAAEDELFLHNSGKFLDFYEGIGMPLKDLPTKGVHSIIYALANMDPRRKTLLVHNTMTRAKDIEDANDWSNLVYWATCPNANLYIENRLPDYQLFIDKQCKMTIGTDSLSSNWQLSIWEEMKTISKYKSYVDFDTLLKWATINGAEALSYHDELGSIEVGKRPGILNVHTDYLGNKTNIQNVKLSRVL